MEPTGTGLYKTTVIIWSRLHPEDEDLDLVALAQSALDGSSYCSKAVTAQIPLPAHDPDWDGTEFFESTLMAPSRPPLRTVTPDKLDHSYRTLFPGECSLEDIEDHTRIMGNWLTRYESNPESAVATTNWAGKVTQALFHALHLTMPRTKRDRLLALQSPPIATNQLPTATQDIHRHHNS